MAASTPSKLLPTQDSFGFCESESLEIAVVIEIYDNSTTAALSGLAA
jgi:hypothetical protein